MHLGMPGGEEDVTKNLTSPKSEHVNARYSFTTGESAAMKAVDRLAREDGEAVKTLPSTYSYSRPNFRRYKMPLGQNQLGTFYKITRSN